MTLANSGRIPWWFWTWPAFGLLILLLHFIHSPSTLIVAAEGFALIATVFAAVHHAEIVALRVGEPFGTLVLASIGLTIPAVASVVRQADRPL